jgi:hypothetical protein
MGNTPDVLFECLAGLIAIGVAARLRGFWAAFSLAWLGMVLIYHGGWRADYFDQSLVWITMLIGVALLAAAAVLRRSAWAPSIAVIGAGAVFLGVLLLLTRGASAPLQALVVPGAALLGLAALIHRRPVAPAIALLGLFVVAQAAADGSGVVGDVLSGFIYGGASPLANLRWDASYAIVIGLWLLAIAACGLFAPKHIAVRIVLYVLIATGLAFHVNLLAFDLGTPLGSTSAWVSEIGYYDYRELFYDIGAALWIALAVILAHGRLFDVAPAPRAGAPADVFISYKREDRARVEEIAAKLRAQGLTVWFDVRLMSGKSFDAEINHQVRIARAVLVCWSKAAVGSEWVRAEASIGRDRGVLAACFLETCEPFPPFNLVHAEDMTRRALDSSNPGWMKLLAQLSSYTAKPATEPVPA